MRESPPTTCPRCRYELDRVPVRDECPECALALNEYTAVFRPRSRTRPLLVAASFAAPFGIGLWTLARRFVEPPISNLELMITAIIFVLSAFFLIGVMRTNRRGRFLAVGPFGINARTWRGDFFVPWSDYDYVYGIGRGIRLIRRNGRSTLRIPGVFDHGGELDQFREDVIAADVRRERAAGSGG